MLFSLFLDYVYLFINWFIMRRLTCLGFSLLCFWFTLMNVADAVCLICLQLMVCCGFVLAFACIMICLVGFVGEALG